MNFKELVNRVNSLDVKDEKEISDIISNIDINQDNISEWINTVFSDEVESFNMGKLPYLIDGLYKSDERSKFMLGCMLIEATCDKLEFITKLENYPLFEAKFKELLHTLVTVYDRVDNGIANCMSLIILNTDPRFTYFDDGLKDILVNATIRKLNDLLDYLKGDNINPEIYDDLEIIIDMVCYLNNNEISKLVEEIDRLDNNDGANLFIIKYKLINGMSINIDKLNKIRHNDEYIVTLYNILETLGVNNKYLSDVTNEEIALSDMIRWLEYPTELGTKPDKIELLGDFEFNNSRMYAFKFSKEGFKFKGDLLGISGGYPLDKVSAKTNGYTFSKFESVKDDWKEQAIDIATFIYNMWMNKQ